MVSELMARFGRQSTAQALHDSSWSPDWVSPTTRTRVIRHGSSASLHSVLIQAPDAISAEYEVLYRGARVFSWCEYLWPQLREQNRDIQTGMHYMPQDCLDELLDFHVRHGTHWLNCYQRKLSFDRAIEVDKVGVMAQADCIELW